MKLGLAAQPTEKRSRLKPLLHVYEGEVTLPHETPFTCPSGILSALHSLRSPAAGRRESGS